MNTKQTIYRMLRPCFVKVGDLVKARLDDNFYGFVTGIDISSNNEYYVEVVYDIDADPIYFYDDELETVKIVKE